jgi:hypothetical protein
MTAAEDREALDRLELIELLAELLNPRSGMSARAVERLAERLAPVVDKIARRRAAEELRTAANWAWTPQGDAKAIHDELQNRADALEPE